MNIFSPLVEQAVELAAEWHDNTYRKGRWRAPAFTLPEGDVLRVPVMAHLTMVAFIVQQAGWDETTVAAAFLHDVLEDRNRYRQRFQRDLLAQRMGAAVTALVEMVTEERYDDDGNFRSWQARKEGYIATLRTSRPQAVAISLADKLHNLWSMNQSLAEGIDIFTDSPDRRGLSAGPEEQLWFNNAVLEASKAHSDERLAPMRARLQQEINRFRQLTGQTVTD